MTNDVIPEPTLASIMQAIQAMQQDFHKQSKEFHKQIQGMARALSGQPDVSENTGVPTVGGGAMLLLLPEPL